MKKIIITILLFQSASFANAQYQTDTSVAGSDYYINPIFAGDYPDPSQ
jgi:xylan 1,4-beta-xylosidase